MSIIKINVIKNSEDKYIITNKTPDNTSTTIYSCYVVEGLDLKLYIDKEYTFEDFNENTNLNISISNNIKIIKINDYEVQIQ